MSPYIAGDKASIAAKFKHHGSVRHLWDDEWKVACQRGAYPFNEGTFFGDFEPIFQSLIKKDINDPFDDLWPQEFVPRICDLISQADSKRRSEPEEASKLFLRAAAICHLARFPVLNSTLRRIIWSMQKEAYTAGTSFWTDPVKLLHVPHKYATSEEGSSIPLSYRFPSRKADSGPVPVLLCISGLDGFRIDYPGRCTNYFNAQGWAIVGAEIPGCGDSPAAKMDPESPDRLWSSVLDWIAEQPELDENNVCAWGFSTGGYYSLRAAHTHASRLKGVIAQGLYAHHALSPEWIDVMDSGEYPASLTRSLMSKYDYNSVEEMKAGSQKRFSLVENGILDKPHTKLLIINGIEDTIYPIEDSYLVLSYGGPKEAKFTQGRGHMGEPQAGPVGFAWLKRLFEVPQYRLEEALNIYQEALKLQSQLALQDKKAIVTRRESRNGRRVSGIFSKSHPTNSAEPGARSPEYVRHGADRDSGSLVSRERKPLSYGHARTRTNSSGAIFKLSAAIGNVAEKPSPIHERFTEGPTPHHETREESTTDSMPTTPEAKAHIPDVVIRAGSDTELDDQASEKNDGDDRRLSGTLNGVEGILSLVPSQNYNTTTGTGSPKKGPSLTVNGMHSPLTKKSSFEDMYGYIPAGIDTEVIFPKDVGGGAVIKDGLLTPESPNQLNVLSAAFDRTSRPISVYRNENSKWDQSR